LIDWLPDQGSNLLCGLGCQPLRSRSSLCPVSLKKPKLST
jgi:hypothetical protein